MKIGDTVFFDFNEAKIVDMNGNKVTEVERDNMHTYGADLKCFPYSISNELITTSTRTLYTILYGSPGNSALDFCRLHSAFVYLWTDAMNRQDVNVKQVRDFAYEVLANVQVMQEVKVHGVKIFK